MNTGVERLENKSRFHLKLLPLTALVLALSALPVSAQESLLEDVRAFDCEGELVVLHESADGWELPTAPSTDVSKVSSGWRIEQSSANGFLSYLRLEEGSWVIQGINDSGIVQLDCVDLRPVVVALETILVPLLHANNLQVQNDLTTAKEELNSALMEIGVLTGLLQTREDEVEYALSFDEGLASARVRQLCTYLATNFHSTVLERTLYHEGQRFLWCE